MTSYPQNSQSWPRRLFDENTNAQPNLGHDANNFLAYSSFVNSNPNNLDAMIGGNEAVKNFPGTTDGTEAKAQPDGTSVHLARWWKDGPWNSQQVNGFSPTSIMPTSFTQVRESLKSDTSSVITGRQDSGYGTKPSTYSVASNEPISPNQESLDISNSFDGFQPFRQTNQTTNNLEIPTKSHYSPATSPTRVRSQDHPCPQCGEEFRLNSELKKHILKHERPFLCDQPKCEFSEPGHGFTTRNDLERHQWSKHGIFCGLGTQKYYICAAASCAEKPKKKWPRQDNFRAHVIRVHKDEDREALIKRSEYIVKNPIELKHENVQFVNSGPIDPTFSSFQPSQDGSQIRPNDQFGSWPSSQPSDVLDHNPFIQQSENQSLGIPTLESPLSDKSSLINSEWPNLDISNQIHDSLESSRSVVGNSGNFENGPLSRPEVVLHQDPVQDEELVEMSSALAAQCNDKAPEIPLEQAIYNFLEERKMQKSKDSLFARNSYPDLRDWRGPRQQSRPNSTISQPFPTIQRVGSNFRQDSPGSDTSSREQGTQSKNDQIRRKQVQPGINCSKCSKILPRSCDLKKHMRRHTRPFACTYDSCHRKFGSKNDWKRHENSQHHQVDCWRCEEPKPGPSILSGEDLSQICGMVFYRKELFATHLQRKHSIIDQELLATECKQRRIGKHGQESFWCGFCKSKQSLEDTGLHAWDERFNHIGKHFTEEKRQIEEWEPLHARGNETKNELERLQREGFMNLEEEYKGEEKDEIEMTGSDGSIEQNYSKEYVDPMMDILYETSVQEPPPPPPPQVKTPEVPKRKHSIDKDWRQRSQEVEAKFSCCQCHGGYELGGMDVACLECEHRFCGKCYGSVQMKKPRVLE